jgi:hypothetical protein
MRRFLSAGCWLCSIGFLLLNAGCATHYTESRDATAATVTAFPPAWIVSIDGRKVSAFQFSKEKPYRISPGEHLITVRYSVVERKEVLEMDHGMADRNSQLNWGGRHMDVDPRTTQWQQTVRTVHVQSKHDVPLNIQAVAGRSYYIRDGQTETGWDPYFTEYREPVFLNLPYK